MFEQIDVKVEHRANDRVSPHERPPSVARFLIHLVSHLPDIKKSFYQIQYNTSPFIISDILSIAS